MLHGQTRYNIPSRFLQEIPDSLLKWLNRESGVASRAGERSAIHHDESIRRITPAANPPYTATVPAKLREEMSASPWRIGQNVAHAKFGSGVIINCEGHGADARVQVQFSRAGTKWLSLEYAKLVAA